MTFRSEFQPFCNCTKFQKMYSAAFLAGMCCIAGWTQLFPANPLPEKRHSAEQAWHVLQGLAPPATTCPPVAQQQGRPRQGAELREV